RPVVPLHEARVHQPAHRRGEQRQGGRRQRPEHHPRAHPHHPVVLPVLVNRRVGHLRRQHRVRLPRPPRPPRPLGHSPPPPGRVPRASRVPLALPAAHWPAPPSAGGSPRPVRAPPRPFACRRPG